MAPYEYPSTRCKAFELQPSPRGPETNNRTTRNSHKESSHAEEPNSIRYHPFRHFAYHLGSNAVKGGTKREGPARNQVESKPGARGSPSASSTSLLLCFRQLVVQGGRRSRHTRGPGDSPHTQVGRRSRGQEH